MAYLGKCGLAPALLAMLLTSLSAFAANLSEVEAALQTGELARAQQLISNLEPVLGPDPQLQYLKGLLAHRQGELSLAARIFERLHQQHPETPEPGNNLAVVLAAQGQALQAAAVLKEVLAAHPDYLPALENQAALHAQQASLAAQRAAALTPSTSAVSQRPVQPSASPRPSPVSQPGSVPTSRSVPGLQPMPARTKQAPKNTVLPPAPSETPKKAGLAKPQTTPAALPSSQAAVPSRSAATAASIPAVAMPAWRAHQQWLEAWQRGDAAAYLSHYAADFEPSLGQSRQSWAEDRREKVPKARAAQISVSDVQTKIRRDGSIDFRYVQSYTSERYSDQTRKRLVWAQRNGRWQIIREQVLL
nr:tetratricopeptide repeat protein [Oceanococcus sp. HetDA_MAG_MS8]